MGKSMISYEEGLHIVTHAITHRETETVEINCSHGRILATEVFADMDMPPFEKSAMDGYACRKEDLSHELQVIEEIPAGKHPEKIVTPGKCSKIMTGAPLPEGADMVIMKEDVEHLGRNSIRFTGKSSKPNICKQGEDVTKGQKVCKDGALITPQIVATLAAFGYAKIEVFKKPRVVVMATGSELVEPKIKPGISQIRNSNSYQILTQLQKTGVLANYAGIIKDISDTLSKEIKAQMESHDVLIVTGGASVGDYDYVPQVLESLGFTMHFNKLAIQPGKPISFASTENKFIFGLSGNPVSSFLQFELLVKPFLLNFMGYSSDENNLFLPMSQTHQRKKDTRLGFFPVKLSNNGELEPIEFHGSAHIFSLVDAFGLAAFPIGVTQLEKGEKVYVRQI